MSAIAEIIMIQKESKLLILMKTDIIMNPVTTPVMTHSTGRKNTSLNISVRRIIIPFFLNRNDTFKKILNFIV